MRTLYRKGVVLSGYTGLLETNRSDAFDALFDALRSGKLRVPIDCILPLAEAGRAHERILAKNVRGKILLDVNA